MVDKQYVICEKSDLVCIADAVRAAIGSKEKFNVENLKLHVTKTIESGGIDTSDTDVCSILIPQYANCLSGISYVKCENGVCAQTDIIPDASSFTITNVLCNSIVYINYTPYYVPKAGDNCELITYETGCCFLKLIALPGEITQIDITYNDF